ncbi:MAG: hypothetical protein MJ118_02865 [Clostridia bacterium]|nr:hypothetical protein [Clostridia bacterium]
MSTMKIGWSEISITSEKKVSLAGQFAERISEYVEKPLTATAMAVEADGAQMVLCSADLSGISLNLTEDVRARLADNEEGLDPEKVILCAIHTHTGPVYPKASRRSRAAGGATKTSELLKAMLPEGRKYVEKAPVSNNPDIEPQKETYAMLVKNLSKVVLDAWKARTEGGFANAFGRAAVGMCRRAVYSDGSAKMWGETNTAIFKEVEGGSDSGMELLYVFNGEKKLSGIVVNLACPAQCVQHRLFVSPDFWGEVKVRLRKRFGEDIFMLPLCSAAGDQCPVDIVRWVEPYSDVNDPNIERLYPVRRKADPSMFDLDGMKMVGRRIAREVIDIYEDGVEDIQSEIPFTHVVRHMHLPIRRVSAKETVEAEKAIREYLRDHPGDVDYNDAAKLQIHLGTISRSRLQEKLDLLDTEVHIIRMGSVAIATNPFELFLDYGNQIKARSKAEQTFLVQLACHSEGYLPTEKAEKGGHYSAFVSSGSCGHEGGDLLVRETLTEIEAVFAD